MRILVVEDEYDIASIVRAKLQQQGYIVDVRARLIHSLFLTGDCPTETVFNWFPAFARSSLKPLSSC
jgi:DNA-binding response OmpR family regulator